MELGGSGRTLAGSLLVDRKVTAGDRRAGKGRVLSNDVSTRTGANENLGAKVPSGGNSGGTNMRARRSLFRMRKRGGRGFISGRSAWDRAVGSSSSARAAKATVLRVKACEPTASLVKRCYPTRLETRTKESNMYASLIARNKRAKRKRNG